MGQNPTVRQHTLDSLTGEQKRTFSMGLQVKVLDELHAKTLHLRRCPECETPTLADADLDISAMVCGWCGLDFLREDPDASQAQA